MLKCGVESKIESSVFFIRKMFSVSQFFVNLVHGKTFCSRSVKIESFSFLSPALQQYVSRYLQPYIAYGKTIYRYF